MLSLALLWGAWGAALAESGAATGLSDTTLRIGLHSAFSGPSPVDPEAVTQGAELYWRYLHDVHGRLVHGRRIEVVVENDQGAPSMAVQRCDAMAGSAFLLMGASGDDQVNACAHYADDRGVPYFAAGAHEAGLDTLSTFAALSATWPRQAPIIAEYLVNRLGATVDRYGPGCPLRQLPLGVIPLPPLPGCGADGQIKVGLVRSSSVNPDQAERAFRDRLEQLGYDAPEVYTFAKQGNSTEASSIANAMERDGIDVVVALAAPLFTTLLTANTGRIGYFPRFLLFGVASGWNAVVPLACGRDQLEGASIFMPWPAWSAMADGSFDPDFRRAAQRYAADLDTAQRGDVLVWLWGMMKSIHQMLEAVGPDPTRDALNAMLDAGYTHSTGVFPDFSVAAGDRFGVEAVHRLEASCDEEPQWHQGESFVTGYPSAG